MLYKLTKVALFAALASVFCCRIASAGEIVTGQFTGNLYFIAANEQGVGDSDYGQLCGGCDYTGPATLTYSIDLTQLAGSGGVNCSSSPGNSSECTDTTNSSDVSLSLSFGAYSVTFSNDGGAAPYGNNSVQLSPCAENCTGLFISASNSSTQAPPLGGEMWAYFYNYSETFENQSAMNAADISELANNSPYVQGYIGPQFGGGSPYAYWDYFTMSDLQPTIPEPATWALFASGLASVFLCRRR